MRLLIAILFCCLGQFQGWAFDIDLTSAISLNTVTLYQDSSFLQEISDYREGMHFRVLSESHYQHPDADQKQKFKWFQVEAPDGKRGWVFGDGLATFVPQADLPQALRGYFRKKVALGTGFNRATAWVASINGRDNFHAEDYLNPLYSELYLVVTNSRRKSVFVKCGGESARGETLLDNIDIVDVTGDGNAEIILQRRTFPLGSNIADRELEIFSMRAGLLASVFSDRISLGYDAQQPSPAVCKFVEISFQSIRIAYLDYVPLSQYSLEYELGELSPRKERALEYVTVTYIWDNRQKKYYTPYGETRLAPSASLWEGTAALQPQPGFNLRGNAIIRVGQQLSVIKHHEEYLLDQQGRKKLSNWLLVEDIRGNRGYLPAEKLGFVEMEHEDLVNRYYLNPPLSKQNWQDESTPFVIVNVD